MSKQKNIFLLRVFCISVFFFLTLSRATLADTLSCNSLGVSINPNPITTTKTDQGQINGTSITLQSSSFTDGVNYQISSNCSIINTNCSATGTASNGQVSINVPTSSSLLSTNKNGVSADITDATNNQPFCKAISYSVQINSNVPSCQLSMSNSSGSGSGLSIPNNQPFAVSASGLVKDGSWNICYGGNSGPGNTQQLNTNPITSSGGGFSGQVVGPISAAQSGYIWLETPGYPCSTLEQQFCKANLTVTPAGNNNPQPIGGTSVISTGNSSSIVAIPSCTAGQTDCTSSAGIFCDPGHIQTAIGCVPTDPQELIQGLIKFVVAASGGIALLLMIFGAIGMITSQGEAEALKAAQGRFVSAIVGLLFIIFSVFLLKVIGVDILSIPGFNP